jgi:hypothetical protein
LITVHSSANMFEGGTGCHMWDAGFLLAEFVLNNRQLFKGRHARRPCVAFVFATCIQKSASQSIVCRCLEKANI